MEGSERFRRRLRRRGRRGKRLGVDVDCWSSSYRSRKKSSSSSRSVGNRSVGSRSIVWLLDRLLDRGMEIL